MTNKSSSPPDVQQAGPLSEARSSDRFLISMSKCEAVLTTEDGQSADGYLSDAAANSCCFVTAAGQLRLRKGQTVAVAACEARFEGSVVRVGAFGMRADFGIAVPAMPKQLLDRVCQVGGAVRINPPAVAIVGRLTMPVAMHALRLMRLPEFDAVDLRACTGLELAGAGFLILATERGKKIVNVPPEIEKLITMAGIDAYTLAAGSALK